MNFKTSSPCATANYNSQPSQATSDAPDNGGLYDGLQSFRHRLAAVNNQLDSMLQRSFGPRPQSAGEGKNPEQPSIKQIGSSIEQEIYSLEKMVQELANFIG